VFQRDLEATLTVFNWPFTEVHERPLLYRTIGGCGSIAPTHDSRSGDRFLRD
jgi:hypothetical protein